ncbi:MAG: hypothetical protein M1817_000675 [Caeruleum heppii]|nr:MAG: hypothetical protein M1817_000675 [Caeruleum heppii]
MASPRVVELSLLKQKKAHFRGSARVQIKHLRFETHKSSGTRSLDPANVRRLERIFEIQGCARLDPEHYVPALISKADLDRTLARSAITPAILHRFDEPPTLDLDPTTRLTCLHGKHRLQAAEHFLLPGDKWWVVDLYAADLPADAKSEIREEYSNALNFSDGDIYRNVRRHQRRSERAEEGKWLARLTESKRKDLRQLQTLSGLSSAFDRLLPFVGLWSAMQLGKFHRILTLKCLEELEHYLAHVHDVWTTLTLGREELRRYVDADTVELLQLRFPTYSLRDRSEIRILMNDGKLFPGVADEDTRCLILDRLQMMPHMVPSLHTFFEDTKYLEPCAKILKRLLPAKFKGSIKRAIIKRYTGVNRPEGEVVIQESKTSFSRCNGSETEAIMAAYRQLWLFAMRHFPDMIAVTPRKDAGGVKPEIKEPDEECWHRYAELTYTLGFDFKEIHRLREEDPDRVKVEAFLRQARPPEQFQFDEIAFDAEVQRIYATLKKIQPRQLTVKRPSLSRRREEAPLAQRCGRPFEKSHYRDRNSLFLRNIYNARHVETKDYVTSFAVKRSVFFAFFGHDSAVSGLREAHSVFTRPSASSIPVIEEDTLTTLTQATMPGPMEIDDEEDDTRNGTAGDELASNIAAYVQSSRAASTSYEVSEQVPVRPSPVQEPSPRISPAAALIEARKQGGETADYYFFNLSTGLYVSFEKEPDPEARLTLFAASLRGQHWFAEVVDDKLALFDATQVPTKVKDCLVIVYGEKIHIGDARDLSASDIWQRLNTFTEDL